MTRNFTVPIKEQLILQAQDRMALSLLKMEEDTNNQPNHPTETNTISKLKNNPNAIVFNFEKK